MSDINELKGTLLNTLGSVAEKTRSLAGKAADKAKDVTKIAKLNMEVGAEKDNIQKAYLEIGKLYYEMHKSEPDSFFVQLCDEITLANENLGKLRAELDELKAGLTAKGIDIEVELAEEAPCTEEAPVLEDDFVQESPESVEEATEAAEPAAEATEEKAEN